LLVPSEVKNPLVASPKRGSSLGRGFGRSLKVPLLLVLDLVFEYYSYYYYYYYYYYYM